MCFLYHSLRFCRKFLAMDSTKRNQVVRRRKYCLNCLARTHVVRDCTSPDSCLKCGLTHHTLLHPDRHPRVQPPKRSVRERVGQRNAGSSRPRIREPNRKKPKRLMQPTSANQPNQKILSEAIRSLAAVLCKTSTTI